MHGVTQTPTTLVDAREQFLAMIDGVRPELHCYCARLTGSVIEGEDIVQETLAKAFYALSLSPDVPPLRPWLFRIAHNAALDFLKSHGKKYVEAHAEIDEFADFEDKPDPAVVRAALTRFLSLPVTQRSAVILKDVLGHSLEEAAETMGTTVLAVKAALVRGRGKLMGDEFDQATITPGRPVSNSTGTRASSTLGTGTVYAHSSATTAGSTWSPGRNVAASRSVSTSDGTKRRMFYSAWCIWRGGSRSRHSWAARKRPPTSSWWSSKSGRVASIRDFRYGRRHRRGGRVRDRSAAVP